VTDPLAIATAQLDALDGDQLAILEGRIRARAFVRALRTVPSYDVALRPLLNVRDAAPLLGMAAATLKRRAKSDPAIKALTVDNGTRLLQFDAEKVRRFRERRAG